jgi:NAD-dependent deacetylase
MPEAAMGRAQAVTLKADLFLVLGSSLVVYPAAGFPKLAAEMGTRVVIINREPTAMDIYAELVIHGEIGEILGAAVGIE